MMEPLQDIAYAARVHFAARTAEKALYQHAANAAGMRLSTWLRITLNDVARRQIQKSGAQKDGGA